LQNHYCNVIKVSRLIAFALLFSYLSAVLCALSPLAYYCANQDYIVQNLCENKITSNQECQGKCYLNNQLSEAAEKQSHESSIELEKFPELLRQFTSSILHPFHRNLQPFSHSPNLYFLARVHDVFHPPTSA